MPPRIAIIGGGAIGLAIAWRLAARGVPVDVLDAGPIPGGRPHAASWAAAGFLAPTADPAFHAGLGQAAAHAGHPGLDALTRLAATAWPAFAAELRAASDVDVELRTEGTLVVALTDDDLRRLRASYDAYAADPTVPQQWLSRMELAAREPALAWAALAARWSGGDVQVDNRRLVEALAAAATRAGARLHPHTVATLDLAGPAPRVATTAGTLPCDTVVVAAGAWSATLPGLPTTLAPPVRPVAGQMVALRMPAHAPLVRHVVLTPDVYLVPRADGRLLVGATVEERGFDAPLTARGVRTLLDGARRALPTVDPLPIAELWSGLRPGSPDGAPFLGWLADRLAVAAGHHRNGILLTPVTADAMAALLLGDPPPPWLAAFAPDRAAC